MFTRLIARTVSLGLAAVVTLGLLGGIDRLAQPDEAAPQWAQQSLQPSALPRG